MTYRELAVSINDMPDDEQDCEVIVLEHQEEIFGVVAICPAINALMDAILDAEHPLLILNGVFTKNELEERYII